MQPKLWVRALAAAIAVCTPMLAGDYDHLLGVIRDAWPERNVVLSLCDKDANQMALMDLAEAAKGQGLSLIIMDLRDEKGYNATMANAMAKNPGVLLILDGDALAGVKGRLTSRMIYRVGGKEIPAVGLSRDLLALGATLATGTGEDDPVFVNKAVAKRMKISLPETAVDPSEKKK
jgi:hypothetical protein